MSDRYQTLVRSTPGRFLASRLGLPQPARLRRYEPGQPPLAGPALIGGSGRLIDPAGQVLASIGALSYALDEPRAGAGEWNPQAAPEQRFAALVFDASSITASESLRPLYDFFHTAIRNVDRNGRAIVLATPPEHADGPRAAVAQRSLEGFVRSAAKELRGGATAQLVYVAPGAEGGIESTLRFLLSSRSAFVDAQVIRIAGGDGSVPGDWERPLDGRLAVVTGASRGIGESIATTLARDGAHVVCLDVPAAGEPLAEVANRIGGSALQLDVTDVDAPARLVEHLRERGGGVDVLVHNAGITRDRTLARMTPEQWDAVIAVNLTSQERINDALLEAGALRTGGRVVCVSSLSGIAGNRGQANYATSKAGVAGVVQAYAPLLAERGATINAVAPGFIETQMTAAMPIATREAGRRLNSLSQGGLPIDVAETIAWLASPGSGGVNGNVVRVCGQSLLGA